MPANPDDKLNLARWAMSDNLDDKLKLTRWELGNYEEASLLETKKACLCFAAGYLNEMIEILDKQIRAKRLNEALAEEAK